MKGVVLIMEIVTKLFGTVGVDDSKVISFDMGMIGFPDLKKYLLIHDSDKEGGRISWLQSIEEPALAFPVIDPLSVKEDYNPVVEDELLKPIGDVKEGEMFVLCTVTVPSDATKATANLKAPIVINTETRKACQIIVDSDEYQIKYPIFDKLKEGRENAEC